MGQLSRSATIELSEFLFDCFIASLGLLSADVEGVEELNWVNDNHDAVDAKEEKCHRLEAEFVDKDSGQGWTKEVSNEKWEWPHAWKFIRQG